VEATKAAAMSLVSLAEKPTMASPASAAAGFFLGGIVVIRLGE
jgi:hypothetical protein